MKKRWSKIKRVLLMRHEDFNPKQQRVFLICDLAFIGLILCMIWIRLGCPLPTMEMEFRRMERTHLLPPGEIVLSLKKNESISLDGEVQVRTSAPVIMAVTPEEVRVGTKRDGNTGFYRYSLADGPAVSLDPSVFLVRDRTYRTYGVYTSTAVLVYGVPEEAAGGEITLEAHKGGPLSGPGFRLGKGVWLFAARPKASYSLSGSAPYHLRLYRADGSLLLEKSGTMGETLSFPFGGTFP